MIPGKTNVGVSWGKHCSVFLTVFNLLTSGCSGFMVWSKRNVQIVSLSTLGIELGSGRAWFDGGGM